jgi:hypothetical protein
MIFLIETWNLIMSSPLIIYVASSGNFGCELLSILRCKAGTEAAILRTPRVGVPDLGFCKSFLITNYENSNSMYVSVLAQIRGIRASQYLRLIVCLARA